MVFIVALTVWWSCTDAATVVLEGTAEREVFIETYVDLRAKAMAAGTTEIEAGVRDSILAVYGVTGEGLVEFIDIHGEDVQFMGDLWSEIEELLTERPEENSRVDLLPLDGCGRLRRHVVTHSVHTRDLIADPG